MWQSRQPKFALSRTKNPLFSLNLLIRNNHGEHLWPKNLIDDYRHTGIPSRNIILSSQIYTLSNSSRRRCVHFLSCLQFSGFIFTIIAESEIHHFLGKKRETSMFQYRQLYFEYKSAFDILRTKRNFFGYR